MNELTVLTAGTLLLGVSLLLAINKVSRINRDLSTQIRSLKYDVSQCESTIEIQRAQHRYLDHYAFDTRQEVSRVFVLATELGLRIDNLAATQGYPVSGVRGIAKMLGLSRSDCYRRIKSGELKTKLVGDTYVMTREQLDEALALVEAERFAETQNLTLQAECDAA